MAKYKFEKSKKRKIKDKRRIRGGLSFAPQEGQETPPPNPIEPSSGPGDVTGK